ncbi:collagenase [Thalassotalea sp. PLHSN55]|uniref:collagenase n=1 Tax=Thalassotalea sp. PLHSN55 TaxID=3435888 RepID=UPI003F826128
MKIIKIIAITAITTWLVSACANVNHQAKSPVKASSKTDYLASKSVQDILSAELETLWSQDFKHYQQGLLFEVAKAISQLANKGDLTDENLEKLSFYLRIYSSFGPDENWQEGSAQALNRALVDLQNMPGFYHITPSSARLHENYAVALYRLYFLKPLRASIPEHLTSLAKLVDLYGKTEWVSSNEAADYALWEILRASAILPYEASRKKEASYLAIFSEQSVLTDALLTFIESENATLGGDNWPQQHAVWALAHYYNVYNKQYLNAYYEKSKAEQKQLDDDEISLPVEQQMADLDNALWQVLSDSITDSPNKETQVKTLFSIPYVVSTYRGKSDCLEGSLQGRCITPTVDEAVPIKHVCSDSLFIRTQKMTPAQLDETCQQLISQETVFHQKLATNHEPAANDFNDKLRVVVFHNAAEYNKYGQLVFDISTDNGGMYIEGVTQDPDNLATFYSFEHFWVRPKFQIWNLQHEYVHYLDGRFNKYDTFNHFPSHLVWWSEGLADYIAKGDDNPQALKLLKDTEQEKWLTLQQVFDTEYRDGGDQVYKWGYLAVRFMYERHVEEYRQLAHFLKTDFFDGYKKLLDESGEQYQSEFNQWLVDLSADFVDETKVKNPHKPRQFYRYSYKDYLQPVHLVETPRHMHWQYWHANALQN